MTKVGPLTTGKAFKVPYNVVHFALENGRFAMSYLAPNYRNHRRWGDVKVGHSYSGVRMLEGSTVLVDADSPVSRDDGPQCRLITKKKPVPPPPKPSMKQGDLFG